MQLKILWGDNVEAKIFALFLCDNVIFIIFMYLENHLDNEIYKI